MAHAQPVLRETAQVVPGGRSVRCLVARQQQVAQLQLDVAALGNLVPQLHVHVIARRTSDAAWPRPVWGVMPPLAHDAEEVQNFINALRRKIWLG